MRPAGRSLCIGLLFTMVLSGCSILPTEEEFDAAPLVAEYEGDAYSKYTVTKGDMTDTESISVTYQGTIESDTTGVEEGGQIKKICVTKGQKVKKGTVLYEEYLEDEEDALKEDEREIESLKLQIRQAKQMKKRELTALSRTGGTKTEKQNVRDQYDAQIKNCQSSLELTKLDVKELEETIAGATVKSHIAGTVTYVDTSFEGGYANEENVIVTVRGVKKNRFRGKTKYADKFEDGEEVTVTVSGQQYPVTVKKADNNVIYLYPKKNAKFQNDTSGTVDLILEQKKDVLYLPTALVHDLGDSTVVYIEGDSGVKKMREVTTGVQIGSQIEITSGLTEGEQVLTN